MTIQKTILCYGDSNTWGYFPCPPFDTQTQLKRYSRDERWTGLLQKALENDYYVVEEGLNSRTTNLDTSLSPNRNGLTYLPPCLYSHAPIDLVIFALGGNDMKASFNRTAEEVKNGLAKLIDVVQESLYGPRLQASPKILILTQPIPLPICEQAKDENDFQLYEGITEKSQRLIPLYEQLAKEKHCYYLDISKTIRPSEIDGIHYDGAEHNKLAQLIYKKVVTIFSECSTSVLTSKAIPDVDVCQS